MNKLREAFIDELKDLYDAEKQLVKALPKMAKAASSSELQSAFKNHLEQTRAHVERLETIFSQLDEEPEGETCKGMAGLIAEGKEAIEADGEDDVKDAWLIAAAQRVEHYEIAAYGTMKSMASLLDEEEAADLLEETLNEEKETDQHLTELSGEINPRAGGERKLERNMKPMRRSTSGTSRSQTSRQSVRTASKRKR